MRLNHVEHVPTLSLEKRFCCSTILPNPIYFLCSSTLASAGDRLTYRAPTAATVRTRWRRCRRRRRDFWGGLRGRSEAPLSTPWQRRKAAAAGGPGTMTKEQGRDWRQEASEYGIQSARGSPARPGTPWSCCLRDIQLISQAQS